MMDSKPHFFPLWWKLLVKDFQDGDYGELVPWKLFLCIIGGFFLAKDLDYSATTQIISITLIGLLTSSGIIAAMIINSTQHIFTNISDLEFAKYLKDHDIMDYYLFFVIFFQGVLIFSLLTITASIFILQISTSLDIKLSLTSISIGLFAYLLIQTISSTILARDLIYYKIIFKNNNTDK